MILLKLMVTILAFYLVFRKVSWEELTKTLGLLQWPWLLAAFLLYNLSQFISAYRLWGFYININVPIGMKENLALYYKAMFYGLFLPGGVSGDAFKVIRIQKHFQRTYKEMILATLADRLNGLTVLFTLVLVLIWWARQPLEPYLRGWQGAIFPLIPLGWILYYILKKKFAPPHHRIIPKASLLSATVQAFQLAAFFCILFGLGVPPDQWIHYGLLFYVGGIAAAIPVSLSGMGLREWVMVTGSGIFGLTPATGFASAFAFFLVASLSALSGSIVQLSPSSNANVIKDIA
jgi:glycosyltransferase 2 family protein